MPPTVQRFLVVDDNPDARFLLVKALLRKFPGAVIDECHSTATAIETGRIKTLSAIVAHRSTETAGADLVRKLREQNGRVPIVMVSGMDRKDAALAAGADEFLHYDQWFKIGAVVEALLSSTGIRSPASESVCPSKTMA
jgi:DNA-binding response OmpR family regulator